MPSSYSFLDVSASIKGPGGTFPLSSGGVANEGITIAMTSEKSAMITGAGGEGMHSLKAAKSGRVTVRILKNGTTNALMSQLYNFQTTSSAYHGQNTISVRNPITGDTITATFAAFVKHPDVQYQTEGGMMEWAFDAINIDTVLGTGQPVSTLAPLNN
jgi:hypothetical protein